MTNKNFLAVIFLSLMSTIAFAQADSQVDPENFDSELLGSLIFTHVNQNRMSAGLDSVIKNDIFDKAAQSQADDNNDLGRIDPKDDFGKRLKKEGGTDKGTAMAQYASISKGKTPFTYQQVADDISAKLSKSKKDLKTLQTPEFFYGGIGVAVDADKKRVYVTLSLGGVDAMNKGAENRSKLPVKYSKKSYGLSKSEGKPNKNCEKFNNWEKLHNGLYVKGNYVYLDYDNLKELKSILRGKSDGLAIDIVQREQYPCDKDNILDNDLLNRGILLKPWYTSTIFKKNTVKDPKENNFSGPIAKIKKKYLKKLKSGYEMNLLVIQNKMVCKTVWQTFTDEGDQESLTKLNIYPDTSMAGDANAWKPNSDQQFLEFRIPFQVNKYNYEYKDIQPFIEALNEPKFVVNDIFIEAHSSLEGDSSLNAGLQKKRAESIVNAIQGSKLASKPGLLKPSNITTTDSWEIWQEQIKANPAYADFAKMSKLDTKQALRKSENLAKFDSILSSERFALVKMQVSYDISGANEMPYVLSELNKAIAKKDAALALRIQKYGIKQVLTGKYAAPSFTSMTIPKSPAFVSLEINRLFLDTKVNKNAQLDESMTAKFDSLYKIAPDNGFAAFNKYLMSVKFSDLADVKQISEMQKGINALYGTKVTPKYVDALNLEFQFKVIARFDTADGGEDMVTGAIEKIRKIYNIETSTWQDALKLGYIFMKHRDYDFASKVMAPFLDKPDIEENLVFAYISAACHNESNIFTPAFRKAMGRAKEMDESRFCDLFGSPNLSFQILEHPLIKESYCGTCN